MVEKNLFGCVGLVRIRNRSVYWETSFWWMSDKAQLVRKGFLGWCCGPCSPGCRRAVPPGLEQAAHSPAKGWFSLTPGPWCCCPHVLCQEQIPELNCLQSPGCFPRSILAVQPASTPCFPLLASWEKRRDFKWVSHWENSHCSQKGQSVAVSQPSLYKLQTIAFHHIPFITFCNPLQDIYGWPVNRVAVAASLCLLSVCFSQQVW